MSFICPTFLCLLQALQVQIGQVFFLTTLQQLLSELFCVCLCVFFCFVFLCVQCVCMRACMVCVVVWALCVLYPCVHSLGLSVFCFPEFVLSSWGVCVCVFSFFFLPGLTTVLRTSKHLASSLDRFWSFAPSYKPSFLETQNKKKSK